jgi:glycosyltransferase involved in cell wall biosynthesis/peptidoglycan/xylan/chitin deacetylase (PgdA/CDA1 family)
MPNSLYYLIKPLLPQALRIALRRRRAAAIRASQAQVWPIDEGAGATPPNWPGWPGGKRFALVLTHDVEGVTGLSRVRQVMELEQRYGFRSSFNFVPEGEYRVPDRLRTTLEDAGFEVGIHGLKHDGKLYSSRKRFLKRAAGIREYARKWNACGFRSPFMQHRLSWLHELNIEYDASTFDTDPFEPQPDSAGTIFPYWVPGPSGAGYVELPYTLVQDFTLFVILGDRNIDVWKRKIDWIADRGGMVLLNTHPDYKCFAGRPKTGEFPASLYEDLLQYVHTKYIDSFWHALPREVARHYTQALPDADERNTKKKVCMVSYSCYESDNRVRRYAETLAARGDQVDVIALAAQDGAVGLGSIRGVTTCMVQRRIRDERTKSDYLWRLMTFFVKCAVALTRQHRKKQYDVIHIHNIPDFLVFTAWYPKRTGASIILDIHDLVPELYANKFGATRADPRLAILRYIEKTSMRVADHVIVSNHLWQQTVIGRSVPAEKSSVFVNHVDPVIFHRRAKTRPDDKIILLFPGTFQWHQGLDIAIRAFGRLRERLPHAELHLYGDGQEAAALRQLSTELGLDEHVKFCGYVPLDDMPGVIANADLGVVPKRADTFGNEAYSTKIMEFMSQAVPVIASRTKIDMYYFDDTLIRFFCSGDDKEMAEAILDVLEHPAVRERLVTNGLKYVAQNGWQQKKRAYLELVDSLG